MVETTVVRTIRVKGTSEGIEKLTGDLTKLAGAQENVAVVSEQTAKRTLSVEAAWKRQSMQLDENFRNQQRITQATKVADQALQQGLINQGQHAERLQLITQRYSSVIDATDKFTKQTGLARHELINLGRQAQDIGVSLASGQSPLMVLAQQGSQVADVFISSGKSVGSFFSQAAGWAGRFIASAGGMAAAVASVGAAAVYMGASFAAAQREIDKALSGAGAASGLTRGGVNRIAEAAAGGGMSIDDARASVLEFAKTGKIYAENINTATNLTREFARATGVDAAEATKQLADALANPAKGALELNKAIRFLDADTLKYIATLQSMGQLQQAQNALMVAALPALKRQADQVGLLTRAWDAANASVNAFNEAQRRAGLQTFERITGIEAGGFTDQERLGAARARQQDAAGRAARGVPFGRMDLDAATAEVERLEKKLADLAKQTESTRFAQLSLEAQSFGQSLDQTGTQIAKVTEGLAKIAEYQAARLNQGLGLDPALERQAQLGNVILSQLNEQAQIEQRRAQYVAEIALKYQGVSVETGKQLEQMNAQLAVAQAVTGQAQIEAQHQATIVAQLAQQKSLTDAIAIADAQRAISIAQVNTEADKTLRSLQEQGELLRAASDYDRERIKAAQTYQRLIEDEVDSRKAGAIAAQMLANARTNDIAREEAEATRDAAEAARRKADDNQRAAAAAEREAQAAAEMARRYEQAYQAHKFLPFQLFDEMGQLNSSQLYQSKQGGLSQFNPAGYTLTVPNVLAVAEEKLKQAEEAAKKVEEGFDKNLATIAGKEADEAFKALREAIKQNTEAVEGSTAAMSTMTDVLSPFYNSDPRRTHIGFRAYASGGIMTPYGDVALRTGGGGIATSPQVSVFGEGSTPEAYVPVPSGRIPVEMKQPANGNRPIVINQNFNAPVSRDVANMVKRTAFQGAQQAQRVIGQ